MTPFTKLPGSVRAAVSGIGTSNLADLKKKRLLETTVVISGGEFEWMPDYK